MLSIARLEVGNPCSWPTILNKPQNSANTVIANVLAIRCDLVPTLFVGETLLAMKITFHRVDGHFRSCTFVTISPAFSLTGQFCEMVPRSCL